MMHISQTHNFIKAETKLYIIWLDTYIYFFYIDALLRYRTEGPADVIDVRSYVGGWSCAHFVSCGPRCVGESLRFHKDLVSCSCHTYIVLTGSEVPKSVADAFFSIRFVKTWKKVLSLRHHQEEMGWPGGHFFMNYRPYVVLTDGDVPRRLNYFGTTACTPGGFGS